MRTQPCTPTVRKGRLRRAEQFLGTADVVLALSDGHEKSRVHM